MRPPPIHGYPAAFGRERVAPRLLAALAGAALLACVSPARADVSSWIYLGAGPSQIAPRGGDGDTLRQLSLQMETGMGTPPSHRVIFGGLLRVHTHFGAGTDAALLARGATHGFVNGEWGGAVDVGPYRRWWSPDSAGLAGNLVLGAPWGITASAGGTFGNDSAQSFSLTIGVDLARLTVYRRSGDSWWKNPFPAYRPDD